MTTIMHAETGLIRARTDSANQKSHVNNGSNTGSTQRNSDRHDSYALYRTCTILQLELLFTLLVLALRLCPSLLQLFAFLRQARGWAQWEEHNGSACTIASSACSFVCTWPTKHAQPSLNVLLLCIAVAEDLDSTMAHEHSVATAMLWSVDAVQGYQQRQHRQAAGRWSGGKRHQRPDQNQSHPGHERWV